MSHYDYERLWSKVNKDGPIPDERPELGNCWLWTAALDPNGYGRFWLEGQMTLPYHLTAGKPTEGFEWDHLCRTPACVRPDHLEEVTHKENMKRGFFGSKTHCPWGHEYVEENTHVVKATGHRQCLICACVRAYEYRVHTGENKGTKMSKWDYEVSRKIATKDYSFESLIMAAIRQADTQNVALLENAFPDTFAEFLERYDTPGGHITGEAVSSCR